jgi:hypothetical protein
MGRTDQGDTFLQGVAGNTARCTGGADRRLFVKDLASTYFARDNNILRDGAIIGVTATGSQNKNKKQQEV